MLIFVTLMQARRAVLATQVDSIAAEGLRVLGVARGTMTGTLLASQPAWV